ncbi:MAG TPA: hypothetical protein VLC98_11555 [Phnomibacter sp.]|nr:hypothetical protein [Phnomibacter sp.]
MPYYSFRKLLVLPISCLLFSCTKMQETMPGPPALTMNTAAAALQSNMQRTGTNLHVSTIQQVQAYEANGHTYSLISYTNESGITKNMVIESYYNSEGELVETSYRCESSSCDCQIQVYENTSGGYSLRCTCTPCTMFIE